MRWLAYISVLVCSSLAAAQGPQADAAQSQPTQAMQVQGYQPQTAQALESAKASATIEFPDAPPAGRIQQIKQLMQRRASQAILGETYPSVDEWRPMSGHEKFEMFMTRSLSPGMIAGSGFEAARAQFRHKDKDAEYKRGWNGLGHRYAVELARNESELFFQRFLFPAVFRQDPRYYRNPQLPVLRRVLYSVSRVVIAHADGGGASFNASRVLGGAACQALSDLYVPGHRQGMRPIQTRVTLDLAHGAISNLVHEFWPDVRQKLLRR